jgi:hypothetical protein
MKTEKWTNTQEWQGPPTTSQRAKEDTGHSEAVPNTMETLKGFSYYLYGEPCSPRISETLHKAKAPTISGFGLHQGRPMLCKRLRSKIQQQL